MEFTAEELLQRLQLFDEQERIEAKQGSAIGESVMETVCAFANEPGLDGGYLLLGVRKDDTGNHRYQVCGITDPDKLLNDLHSDCSTRFNVPLRVRARAELLEGRTVLVVHVPEAQPADKPIYFKNKPLPKAAWRRGPNGDYQCNEDDLEALYRARSQSHYDDTVLEDATLDDIDLDMLAEYRRERARLNPAAEELSYSDEDLLQSLKCVTRHKEELKPTVAGILLFGKRLALRRIFPMVRVDYIRVPGKEWVEDPDNRFTTIDMRDSIFRLVQRATSAVLDDLPRSFNLPEGKLQNVGQPLIPVKVLREAIVNALMHRNYQRADTVQIIRYANRLEIRNPGYSLKAPDELGEPGSRPRNPAIAAVLHETDYAETKGSGIRTMRRLMEEAGLTPPLFESNRHSDWFTATYLFHHFLSEDNIRWLAGYKQYQLNDSEARALVFVREAGKITNADYRDINRVDTLSASQHLCRLRDLGILRQQGKGPATYYELAEAAPVVPDLFNREGLYPESGTLYPQSDGLYPMSDALSPLLKELPQNLQKEINCLTQRTSPERLRNIIIQLCHYRSWQAEELSSLLRRDKEYLVKFYLRPLQRNGLLEHTIPDSPSSRQQAYRAVQREDS